MPRALVFRAGQQVIGAFEIGAATSTLLIGRDPVCDLVLGSSIPDHRTVSRRHARLVSRDDGLWVEDLGARYFTFLADSATGAAGEEVVLTPRCIELPCQLRLGRVRLELAEERLEPAFLVAIEERMRCERPETAQTSLFDALSRAGGDRAVVEPGQDARLAGLLFELFEITARAGRAKEACRQLEDALAKHLGARAAHVAIAWQEQDLVETLEDWGLAKASAVARASTLAAGATGQAVSHVELEPHDVLWAHRGGPSKPAVLTLLRLVFDPAQQAWCAEELDDVVQLALLALAPAVKARAELERIEAQQLVPVTSGPSPEVVTLANELGLWGNSPAHLACLHQLERAATVYLKLEGEVGLKVLLLTGETGTGKTELAELIHALSHRGHPRQAKLVKCWATNLVDSLAETQLFGIRRGAASGVTEDRKGFFEDADGGSLLLDEIGDLPLALQPRLLGVLNKGEFHRVGETLGRRTRAHVIAATNQDLEALTRSGAFRRDLLERVKRFRIRVPPLRERSADLELLVERKLESIRERSGMAIATRVTPELMAAFRAYDWPGNIRELWGVLECAATMAGPGTEALGLQHLPQEQVVAMSVEPWAQPLVRPLADVERPLDQVLIPLEREYLARQVLACQGNLKEAARRTGVSPTTFYKKREALRVWLTQSATAAEVEQVRRWAGEQYQRLMQDVR